MPDTVSLRHKKNNGPLTSPATRVTSHGYRSPLLGCLVKIHPPAVTSGGHLLGK
jgi:hypothetical protein